MGCKRWPKKKKMCQVRNKEKYEMEQPESAEARGKWYFHSILWKWQVISYNWKGKDKSDRGDVCFWPEWLTETISSCLKKNTGLDTWNNIFKTLCGHQVMKDSDPKELGNESIVFFPELHACNEFICLRAGKKTMSRVQHILWEEDTLLRVWRNQDD